MIRNVKIGTRLGFAFGLLTLLSVTLGLIAMPDETHFTKF
jgi:hypothetical protein